MLRRALQKCFRTGDSPVERPHQDVPICKGYMALATTLCRYAYFFPRDVKDQTLNNYLLVRITTFVPREWREEISSFHRIGHKLSQINFNLNYVNFNRFISKLNRLEIKLTCKSFALGSFYVFLSLIDWRLNGSLYEAIMAFLFKYIYIIVQKGGANVTLMDGRCFNFSLDAMEEF